MLYTTLLIILWFISNFRRDFVRCLSFLGENRANLSSVKPILHLFVYSSIQNWWKNENLCPGYNIVNSAYSEICRRVPRPWRELCSPAAYAASFLPQPRMCIYVPTFPMIIRNRNHETKPTFNVEHVVHTVKKLV